MKKLMMILIAVGLVATNLQAQTCSDKAKLLPSTQAVLNAAINHPEVMVISGKLVDAETYQTIKDAKINFDKFGDELVAASLDQDGNYAVALNKGAMGESVRVIFKIDGYQKYIAKSIKTNTALVGLDLYLKADEAKEVADVKYALSDDPFNKLVIKF
ncbi:MAG: hypothetical protein JST83_17985 [Bacteroidetes bacterium]|nr:hypothetical protein [Bacteroidota bacterium]